MNIDQAEQLIVLLFSANDNLKRMADGIETNNELIKVNNALFEAQLEEAKRQTALYQKIYEERQETNDDKVKYPAELNQLLHNWDVSNRPFKCTQCGQEVESCDPFCKGVK